MDLDRRVEIPRFKRLFDLFLGLLGSPTLPICQILGRPQETGVDQGPGVRAVPIR
tara:strand:- start:548 stop:712 length:165 start_codon:yes stop_codon:yes gene_type:complete